MSIATPFGDNARSTCDIDPQMVLANLQADYPAAQDPQQAILDALTNPVGYPDLAHASVPGDVVLFVFGKDVGDYLPTVSATVSTCPASPKMTAANPPPRAGTNKQL